MARAPRRNNKPQIPFAYKLVLNQWLFGLFGLSSTDGFISWNGRKLPLLEAFKQKFQMSEDTAEGLDENNIHRFHTALINQVEEFPALPNELLLEYDQNIVRHTQRLNERRLARGEEPIVWKYFQYLTLLFTEIYLDRYFHDPDALLSSINEQIESYNEDKPDVDKISLLETAGDVASQLNKLAFWSATGSGKTLIMHANVLQYQHYVEKHGRHRELNRIILLTPNEGLSLQHLAEFQAAGIQAELFDKNGRGLFAGRAVEIIDINKIREEMGDKTVAVDAFESSNLVLIDEGHRGASAGETGAWMRFRNALCEKGFSFEYSATFGQAVKGSAALINQYAQCILFDYSYKYFYGDGFGKDYQILNLDSETQENYLELYLVACLLAFFQQQRLYEEQEVACRPFNIEKPLWIFVGGKVTATLASKDASDIVEILLFLARFLSDRPATVGRIKRVLEDGLVAADGRNLFAGRFAYLNSSGLSPDQLFEEILVTLFNAHGGGALHVENLKGVTGEIALRVGDNDAFGVINVGDDAKLCKLCESHKNLIVGDRDFSGSLFHDINKPHSTVNLLIGAKKFTEGWNSWRVSTMGLMNVGKTEGSQIIQLFGRGVRLKGYEQSLKRSSRTPLPEEVMRPRHIATLETLSIFGIKADYMAQFREFLEEEGLPTNDERIEFFLPVIRNLGSKKLKTIRLKKTINGVSTEFGDAFKKLGPIPTLRKPDPGTEPATRYLQENQVVLNWYPKIQAMKSIGVTGGDQDSVPDHGYLGKQHVAFLDIDTLFFELQRFKAERAWHNLNLSRDAITDLLTDQSWYRLLIPEAELAFDSFEKVRLWQEIATALLKKYCERYYSFRKKEWELPHLEYRDLDGADPNFPSVNEEYPDGYYRILVEESQTEIVDKLKELKSLIDSGDLRPWQFGGLRAIWFGKHLYEPLLHLAGSAVEISPVALNRGERRFVDDLKSYFDSSPSLLEDKELYLLRNMSKGRGVGFFEAGNFHPDFIVWLLVDGQQYITFVDPKGIRNLGLTDPKIQFYETIKEIETRLGDPKVTLNSFVISNTPSHVMKLLWGVEKDDMESMHILFQEEDKDSYVEALLSKSMASLTVGV
ncbi:MAG: DEAD/DEAH box helicase family protein [Candidatus Thiodiazotropha sp. (ex Ctena orbiculata)]|nr:DEAD/DEAH box helicase family protein [Candidatus Thiodiazotropha taylori]